MQQTPFSSVAEEYKVVILEDEPAAAEKLKKYLLSYGIEKKVKYSVKVYNTVREFEAASDSFDLALIDIELPDGNGFESAVRLRERDCDVMIVFVTNMAQYALNGYEVEAFDFIVKPISFYNFSVKLDRAMLKLRSERQTKEKTIQLKTTDSLVVVLHVPDIYYVEVINHTLVYHTATGDYEVYGSIVKAATELEGYDFEFCNRCYLVNLARVKGVKGFEVTVEGYTLQISHLKKKPFMKKLNDYYAFGDSAKRKDGE